MILPATSPQRRKQPRFSTEFAHYQGTEVFLKQERQLNYIGFSTAC